jgi:hypothetical protein
MKKLHQSILTGNTHPVRIAATILSGTIAFLFGIMQQG